MPNPWKVYEPKKYRLFDIFAVWFQGEVSSLGVTVDGEEIFTNQQIFDEMTAHYCSFYWKTVAPDFALQFLDLWHHYVGATKYNLKRAYDALLVEYNPAENYAMREKGVDGVKRDKETRENTPSGKTVSTSHVDRYGLDSGSTGEDYDETTNTTEYQNRKDTEEKTYTNTIAGQLDGQTVGTYNEAHEHVFERSGNIGTQTAADIIGGEMVLRFNADLLREYVSTFMSENCYYVGCEYYDDNTV